MLIYVANLLIDDRLVMLMHIPLVKCRTKIQDLVVAFILGE